MAVSCYMTRCSLLFALLAFAACDRPPEQMWTAKSVRIRPGKQIKAKKIKKEIVAEGPTTEEKAEQEKKDEIGPRVTKLLEIIKAARESSTQDLVAEKKALEEIKSLDRNRVIKHLREALITNAGGLKEFAIRSIGVLKEAKLLAMLTKPLKGSDVYESAAAAWAMGEIGSSVANAQLVTIIGDDERPLSVRVECAQALGKIGNKGAVEPLLEALKSSKEELQVSAAVALGMLKDLRALNPLKDKLAEVKGKDPEVELEIARTLLLYFNDPDATPVIVSRLIGSPKATRQKAVDILKAHENKRELGRLLVGLLAENPGNTFEIIEHMNELCTAESECIRLLKRKKKEVRQGPAVNACDQAIEALKAAEELKKPPEDELGDDGELPPSRKKKKKKKKRRRRK